MRIFHCEFVTSTFVSHLPKYFQRLEKYIKILFYCTGISDDNGQPLLNSIYSISRPGLYELAGTTVSYKRCGTNADGDYEEIIIKQSLTSNIIILVSTSYWMFDKPSLYILGL